MSALPAKTSLWKEGFRNFGHHWKEWRKLGFVFFVLAALTNGGLSHYLDPYREPIQTMAQNKDSLALRALLKNIAPLLSVLVSAMGAVIFVQHYLFLNFFMARAFPGQCARATPRLFFCFMFRILQLAVLLIGGAAIILGLGIWIMEVAPAVSVMMFLPAMLLTFGFFAYFAITYCFVLPLAAANMDRPFKNSRILTKNNWWRLTLNILMVLLVLFVAYFVLIGAMAFVLLLLDFTKPFFLSQSMDAINAAVSYIVVGAAQVLLVGVITSFRAKSCRILYDEKRGVNPGFVINQSL